MAEGLIIETVDLKKVFDGAEALRGVSLRVKAGSICGFLGRNGAGKTTTIKTLLGMVRPTSGEARVFGLSACDAAGSVEIRRRTGFVSEDKDLYDFMTVGEMVRFTASFFKTWRSDREQIYIKRFDLPMSRQVRDLSRGMRTKLALLLALCRCAELLVLDEPTSGLDPAMAEEVLQVIVSHVATDGVTVFFSSHQIAEVEQIADRVAIVHQGRIVVDGALDPLREQHCRIQMVFDGAAPEARFVSKGVGSVRREGRVLNVHSSSGPQGVLEEARALNPTHVEVVPATLRDIFLEVAGKEN